jgi:hypothetical protein
MKRTLVGVVVALAALAAAGVAWSSGVLNGGPAQIRVYGGGAVATPTPNPRTISLEANANPGGLGAWGVLRYQGFRGEVTCLTLAGDSALVGGLIREGPANFVGGDFLYAVTDNGPPASGADTAGFIDVFPELDTPPYPGLPANFPQACPPTIDLNVFGAYPLTGDVSIEKP